MNGFPRVASKIASDPDKTTTIYRRFDRLSARNLLHLEAELAELEALQDKQDADDLQFRKNDDATGRCYRDWNMFENCANEKDEDGNVRNQLQAEKMTLAIKIKEKLKEYRRKPYNKKPCIRLIDGVHR